MQHLVKRSINELTKQLEKMEKEVQDLNEKKDYLMKSYLSSNEFTEWELEEERLITDYGNQLTTLKGDYSGLKNFSEAYLNGDLDIANQIAGNFDTYRRELIPKIVWELLGNKLVHEKDKNILPEFVSIVPKNVSRILLAYKNGMEDYAKNLDSKFFNKFSRHNMSTKDELLIECLKKLQKQEDDESKTLVKKIKNTLN